MALIISGISIEICKKNIKNRHLYVKPPKGNVTVSAPLSMSDEEIERFLRTKTNWIKNQIIRFQKQPSQSEREYISGETLYVWGKAYYLRVECGSKNSLVLFGDKVVMTISQNKSTAAQREGFIREWYRELLKIEVVRLLPKWEKITGLQAASWQTKYMTTRWGTCNPKTRKIWLNVQLAKKPLECLEYIILHELLHFIEKKHDKRFASLLDRYMPMWREIEVTLNEKNID